MVLSVNSYGNTSRKNEVKKVQHSRYRIVPFFVKARKTKIYIHICSIFFLNSPDMHRNTIKQLPIEGRARGWAKWGGSRVGESLFTVAFLVHFEQRDVLLLKTIHFYFFLIF